MADRDVQNEEFAERASQPRLDEALGKRFAVLDDGFVRAVDYMGNDVSVVQAARVSYGTGTRLYRQDRALIRYLLRHRHTTPFEMCEIKLHVRVPMDCWRQWIRHRTANVNEYSTRYSEAIRSMQATAPDEWRTQSTDHRQGSGALMPRVKGERLSAREAELQTLSRAVYDERIVAGVAREQARKDLPLSTYTEAYWKTDLHNLLHFLELRMHDSAQQEIRLYAKTIGEEIVSRWCPLVWEAFVEYRLSAMTLSGSELAVVRRLAAGDREGAASEAESHGLLVAQSSAAKPSGEQREFEAKLRDLGFAVPLVPSV